MQIDKNEKYKVLAVIISPDRVVFGYMPNKYYTYPGDLVELEDCSRGTVVIVDDYVDAENVVKAEQFSMVEFQRVVSIFHRNECSWEDET